MLPNDNAPRFGTVHPVFADILRAHVGSATPPRRVTPLPVAPVCPDCGEPITADAPACPVRHLHYDAPAQVDAESGELFAPTTSEPSELTSERTTPTDSEGEE